MLLLIILNIRTVVIYYKEDSLTIASGNVSIDLGATKVISKVITAVTKNPLAPGVTTIALYSYQHFSETNTYL